MDRQFTYPGQGPLETDLLNTNRYAMEGLGWALQGYLGTDPIIDGFGVSATTPASLAVAVAPGSIYSQQNLDQTAYGSLASVTSQQVIKQGLLKDAVNLTITPPATVGYSQCFLIQIGFQETDANPTVLTYFNSADPSVAYNGPNNSGDTNFVVRQAKAVVQLKAGSAAPTGSQTAPSPDAGYEPLAVITVAQGATTVTAGNIVLHDDRPIIISKLPRVPYDVQSGLWTYDVDTGTANALAIDLYPIPASYPKFLKVKKSATASTGPATITINGLSAVSIKTTDLKPLTDGALPASGVLLLAFDGTSYQLVGGGAVAYDIWIKSDITYTVGSTGCDFTTLQSALDSIRYKLCAPDVTVTFQLAAEKFTITSSIKPQHLNGPRIVIAGAALAGSWPTNTDIVASSATTLATLRTKFATEIACSGCHGFEVTRGQYFKIKNVLFSGGAGYTAVLAGDSLNYLASNTDYYGPGQVTIEKCWAINFDNGFWCRQGSNMTGFYIGSSHCGVGFWINNGSYFIASYITAMRCTGIAGVYCRDRSYIELTGFYVSNCSDKGIAINETAGANILGLGGGWNVITANATWGIIANQMSRADIYATAITGNSSGPISAQAGSYVRFTSADSNTYSGGSMSPAINTVGNQQSYIYN